MFEMARARSTLGPELLLGRKSLTYAVGEHQYQVSAGAFFQTNRFLIPEMVNVVIRERKGRFALDLYCGVGLFTVPLSQRFERVTAVESNAVSVQDLRSNVADNVKVSAQSTEKYLASAGGNLKPDLIVVDPPRTGLGTAVCQHLNRLGAQELIYISCDPATLARDLRQLISDSWRVVEIHLFDIFPQTFHIETCLVLQR
jgi:23S rRNA (uracil1939-C5)-methyltransferase